MAYVIAHVDRSFYNLNTVQVAIQLWTMGLQQVWLMLKEHYQTFS